MRFTVVGLGDVEVPDGAELEACRAGLSRLGGPALAGPLAVGERVLAPDQVAGVTPWVEGSRVTVGPGEPDAVAAALAARWYLAVVSGPDAGLVAAPVAGRVTVGRGAPAAGRLALSDPEVSRDHLVVRKLGLLWVVADTRSANGTWLRAVPHALTRRLPPRLARRRLPVPPAPAGLLVTRRGRLELGGTELRLGSARSDLRRASATLEDRTPARELTATALLPAAGSVALAAALGSPVLAAFGLLGLAPLLPGLRRRFRRPPPAPDPAAAALLVAAGCPVPLAAPAPSPALPSSTTLGARTPPWQPSPGHASHPSSPPAAGVALVGARSAVLAAARARVGSALLDPSVSVELAVAPDRMADWDWCRWLGPRVRLAGSASAELHARPGNDDARPTSLLVVDGAPGAEAHRWWAGRPDGARAVVVTPPGQDAPAWSAVQECGDGPQPPQASRAWAEDLARRLAAAQRRDGLADVVALRDLVDVAAVRSRWDRARGLAAPIGLQQGGEAWLDLAQGPHALVAGTTGAGKSELLQTLVLSLALHHPPEHLALVLIDFKGGAGLGPCRDLPHVLGEVTDLDPAAADRALAGVRAELRRREGLLADAGVSDLDQLRERGDAPPRLVVVVDELRALREDLPDVLPALVRLAAQGRSLGIHLVLATQRPAGALDQQVRANVSIRVCLRVTDVADSLDVLDDPGAAALPADRPGRALVRVGTAPPTAVQTAWAAAAPTTQPVRWSTAPWPPGRPTGATAEHDATAAIVATIRAAAEGRRPPAPLWRPPLPLTVRLDDLPEHVGAAGDAAAAGSAAPPVQHASSALVLGLLDRPEEQRTAAAVWDPATGPLLVGGSPGSGRTTALQTAAAAALRAGREVHVLHAGHGAAAWLPPGWSDMPGLGTVVGTDDPRRAVRLLDLLAAGSRPALLVVDGVAAVQRSCDLAPRGAGDVLGATLRHPRAGLAVACSGAPAELARLVAGGGVRLVLGSCDDEALLGVRAGGPARRSPLPGRGLLVTGREAADCHVALPPADPASAGPYHGSGRALRLAPLPTDVEAAALRAGEAGAIGLGGDDAGPVAPDLARGLLVVGPPRSGRTTALRTAARLARGTATATPVTSREAAGLVTGWAERPAPGRVLVLDDADLLLRDAAVEATLVGWVRAAEAGDPDVPRVLASTRTDRAATSWSGLVAALRAAAPVLVLGAAGPGSGDAAGHDLSRACDPVDGSRPGRGVLVDRGTAVPVQVAR